MTSVGRRRRHCNARTLRLGTYTSSAALQQARAVSRRWNTESPWSQPRRTSAGSQTDTCTRASREHYSRVQVAINQHKDDAAVVQPQNGMSFRKKKKKKKRKKKTSTNTCHHTEGHGKREMLGRRRQLQRTTNGSVPFLFNVQKKANPWSRKADSRWQGWSKDRLQTGRRDLV